MTRPIRLQAIETNDIDLAAVYIVVTGRKPTMYREPGDRLATFTMPPDEQTREVMLAYATGTLKVNVKRFAACRAWLYRQAKGVM
jgi:hypothetical protein